MNNNEGLLLINKPQGCTSFSLIRSLRKLTGIQKIGHAGTLDPFATGVMVILVGRNMTKLSNLLLFQDKEYLADIALGVSTDSYDCDGNVVARCKKKPSLEEIEEVLSFFQGEIQQIPPMFSAKKVGGKKLYELARKGIEVVREPVKVCVKTELIEYNYPSLKLRVSCSKGTYIRSIAYDLGERLKCCAHLSCLQRVRSGQFTIEDCFDGLLLEDPHFDPTSYFINESLYETLSISKI